MKYGLRAYASQGLTAEHVLRALDRLYLENAAFERIESFASVFFGVVDITRRSLSYASGGHEAAALLVPGEPPRLLDPTAPLIGVFDDQHHLFRQLHVELPPGALLVATTDGVTESRANDGEFFGIERFLATAAELAEAAPQTIVEAADRARRRPRRRARPARRHRGAGGALPLEQARSIWEATGKMARARNAGPTFSAA